MSDSPRTTLSHWQELQKIKCELAAAQKQIADARRFRHIVNGVSGRVDRADVSQIPYFKLAEVKPVTFIMRGSIAEHFRAAIDSAIDEP